jgi:[ribosomal protein S18]-alanine N-acetyltransferase
MLSERELTIRPARVEDYDVLVSLTRSQPRVHSHLDWMPVEDWLGTQPFLLALRGRRAVAALACPPDPPDTAWLRLLTFAEPGRSTELWNTMWQQARNMLVGQGVQLMAALSVEGWIDDYCLQSGFERTHAVVVLRWQRGAIPTANGRTGARIRNATPADYAALKQVDMLAFSPPWQMSATLLDLAIESAGLLTVAEDQGAIVGYQLTTPGHQGAHLARLAVLPAHQGRGVGGALLSHLLEHYSAQRTSEVTVNTQDTNTASLRLYRQFGFEYTGDRYPVYQIALK